MLIGGEGAYPNRRIFWQQFKRKMGGHLSVVFVVTLVETVVVGVVSARLVFFFLFFCGCG